MSKENEALLRTAYEAYGQGDVTALLQLVHPEHGKPLRHSNFRRRVWLPALGKAGLPAIHFHDLRHIGNTLAASAGATHRELMDRIGHDSQRAALIYQHSTDQRQRVLADAVDKAARAELRQARRKPAKIAEPARHSRASGTDVARSRKQTS